MKRKKATGKVIGTALAAVLIMTLLAVSLSAYTGEDAEKAYIVRYLDGGAAGQTDREDSVPFEVVSEAEMKRLRDAGLLEWYEPDGDAVLIDPESDSVLLGTISPYYDDHQWNLDMIGADAAFRNGRLGQGVRVGVLDSGVNPHPALAANLLPGHNYMEGAADPEDTEDSFGHGTRVAGLIAAANDSGYIGAAPGAGIVPLKITDGQTVKISAVCRAIYGAVDDYSCDVLNLSLGVTTDYRSLEEAVRYAEEHRVVVVSAIGNGGGRARYYPALYDTVIGVGSVDSSGMIYYRSNHNEGVFVTAPGVDVRTTASTGGYVTSTGTSFAVPQVTAAAAVLRGIDGTLTPGEIRELIAGTACDRGAEGYDEYYGHGILNLAGCVDALTGGMGEGMPCVLLPRTGPASKLRNDSDSIVRCTYLLAEYEENGRCIGVTSRQYVLAPGETVEIAVPGGGAGFGQFVCDTDTMVPLAEARKSP